MVLLSSGHPVNEFASCLYLHRSVALLSSATANPMATAAPFMAAESILRIVEILFERVEMKGEKRGRFP